MTNIQAINLLKGLEQSLDDYCELNDEGKTAFRMAITALEVFGNSEQLPSVQPEPCEDAVSREDCLKALSHMMGIYGLRDDYAVSRANVECMLKSMPSAHPVARDMNVLSNDLISRQAAIDALCKACGKKCDKRTFRYDCPPYDSIIPCPEHYALTVLPSAQPELHYDEWCTDCKEYDQERHCCPRFNKVIRQTVEEYKAAQPSFSQTHENDHIAEVSKTAAQPEQRWTPIKVRPMDDEERKEWSERIGYDIEYDEAVMFDCPMPDDGQEVWVCSKCGNVWQDTCRIDEGIYLEENGDWLDIVAWMPFDKPEPYREEGGE